MNIVILAGGISTERDVSLVTGKMIYQALLGKGHRLVLLDMYMGCLGRADNIFETERDWGEGFGAISEVNPDISAVKAMRGENPECAFGVNVAVGPNVIEICRQADIVFLALHGENGEDGKVQAMFDLLDIKYTGTDYLSSALAMDKAISKELFERFKIPTPKGIVVTRSERGMADMWNIYPCIAKVSRGGSSVGVYIAHDRKELEAALDKAFELENRVIIEQYIEGREFSIGVMDGKALPIIEIAPKVGFYDYKNKYQAGSTVETCPAQLDANVAGAMQSCAESVYRALRLKTYARMDFRMDKSLNFYCLEANTLPGMTPTSLLPQEAAAVGIDFPALCQRIIDISMKKYEGAQRASEMEQL
ncbi:MAG: D-alanine--D-alanine ligase [Lachnospiraceae bacterium]|nr:D-alanine--D-alanine ligase [Lachnospiraceae bacterium]